MSTKAKLTYEDYAALPDDGKRYELVDGELYVTPSANTAHQRVSKRLFRQLEDFFEGNRLGEVFYAPIDMILGNHDVFVPDLVVVLTASQISRRAVEGPADLVVEILSRSNRGYDRGLKARRYLDLGVQHYWIADPDAHHLVCQQADSDAWRVVAEGRESDVITDPAWPTLRIRLGPLWA